MPPLKVTVLLHAEDKGARDVGYVLWPMCAAWEAAGHTVRVQTGLGEAPEGDVVFLHVDLTRTPDDYLLATQGFPCVVNRRVIDISKLLVSRNRVIAATEWDGPVIVKTVRNHGGKPERALEGRGLLGRARDALARRGQLPLRFADWLDPYHYPIFASTRELPSGVFDNPALIVEKFLPERRGEDYCLRSWSFLGDRSMGELYWSPHPIVKRRDALGWEDVPTPPELEAIREELGFDYGKFDYVIHEGKPVLLDVNRSPAFGHSPERLARQGHHLAPGLESIVNRH